MIGARCRFGTRFNITECQDKRLAAHNIHSVSSTYDTLSSQKVKLRWKCIPLNGECLEISIYRCKTNTHGNITYTFRNF